MKKKKVRTLKNYPNTDTSTFILDADNFVDIQRPQSEIDESQNNIFDTSNILESIHKKKKAVSKEGEFHHGLKYAPPSQRNHSSIYE